MLNNALERRRSEEIKEGTMKYEIRDQRDQEEVGSLLGKNNNGLKCRSKSEEDCANMQEDEK